MASESRFIRCLKHSYAAQALEWDMTYRKTLMLLKVYRGAYWSMTEQFEELSDYSYGEIRDSESIVQYLLTFAPEKELQLFEERLQNAAESRLILNTIQRAISRLKTYPDGGEVYYDILHVTYLYYTQNTLEDILDMLDMDRSTYYRKKKEAILLLGYVLFGMILPEYQQKACE